jgi:hypothetical protein
VVFAIHREKVQETHDKKKWKRGVIKVVVLHDTHGTENGFLTV